MWRRIPYQKKQQATFISKVKCTHPWTKTLSKAFFRILWRPLSHFTYWYLRWSWRLEWRFSSRSSSKQLEVYHKICLFTNFQFKGTCIWWDISNWSFLSKANFGGKLPQQTAQIVIAVYENIPYGMRFWQFVISSFDCKIITSHILFT